MAGFDETLQALAQFARSDEPAEAAPIDRAVQAYFVRFDGNKALERDKLANAFEKMFGRRTDRFDFIYRRIKGLD